MPTLEELGGLAGFGELFRAAVSLPAWAAYRIERASNEDAVSIYLSRGPGQVRVVRISGQAIDAASGSTDPEALSRLIVSTVSSAIASLEREADQTLVAHYSAAQAQVDQSGQIASIPDLSGHGNNLQAQQSLAGQDISSILRERYSQASIQSLAYQDAPLLRATPADSYEARLGTYRTYANATPGYNANVNWDGGPMEDGSILTTILNVVRSLLPPTHEVVVYQEALETYSVVLYGVSGGETDWIYGLRTVNVAGMTVSDASLRPWLTGVVAEMLENTGRPSLGNDVAHLGGRSSRASVRARGTLEPPIEKRAGFLGPRKTPLEHLDAMAFLDEVA